MTEALAKHFMERIVSGLKRKSITKPSRWAENYRVMGGDSFPGPWRWPFHPWLKEMHDSDAEVNVGQKAAQMGYTETVLNLTFYKMDIEGVDCLYILPAKTPDATDFSAARFDPALELSPHLRHLFSDVKNVGHKRAGTTNLYIRGSQSRSGLKSVPVGFIVLDEVAEMNQDNIPLAMERASGQRSSQCWMISTPTLYDENINKQYNLSTKEHFFFKCPGCSRRTELIFPECLEVIGDDATDQRVSESFLKCKECGKKLDHELKVDWLDGAKWIPQHSDRSIRGFHIPQMYSSTMHPSKIALSFLKSLISPSDEQEFYNSKLGVPHTVSGARISDEELYDCIGNFGSQDPVPEGLITMGVDVGSWIHYEINQWFLPRQAVTNDINLDATCRVVRHGKVKNFEDLDTLMHRFRVASCVIDANPERRKALEFANRFYGLVKLCYYGKGVNGKIINESKDQTEPSITVDRTTWLDLSLSRFRKGRIEVPVDLSYEYKQHVKAPVRVYSKDKDGNPVGRYESGTKEDHHAHARNYAEIALPLAALRGVNRNMGKVL